MKPTHSRSTLVALAFSACLVGQVLASPLGTEFTYQGRLTAGTEPAAGVYDFRFTLYDAVAAGIVAGGPITNSAVGVTNGLFTTILDFGTAFNGNAAWLEIAVCTNGANDFTTLNPRQPITATPYALYAAGANAGGILGVLPESTLSGLYGNAMTFTNAGNSFSGNGAGLTGVNAATLGGMDASGFWKLTGNAGAIAGANFIGTTDNQPLELKVNGQRAFRIEPTTNSPNVVGGSVANYITESVTGVTIAGGGTTNAPNWVGYEDYPDYVWGASHFGVIGGGAGNSIDKADYGIVVGGLNNSVQGARFGTIAGGLDNQVGHDSAGEDAPYSVISGGEANTISGSSHATISGGAANSVRGHSDSMQLACEYATVGGGAGNHIDGSRSATIGGGEGNWVAGGNWYGTVGGGLNNVVSSDCGTIAGGVNNVIEGHQNHVMWYNSSTTIGGGGGNRIAVYCDGSTIAGGRGNTISAVPGTSLAELCSIGGGSGNIIKDNSFGTIPGGHDAKVSNYGQMAYASGQFATNGDAQTSIMVCRGVSTNATQTELFLDGLLQQVRVQTNSTWCFDILVTGRAADGTSAAYQLRGEIKNNGGTTTLGSAVNKTVLAEDVSSWDATVVPDDTNDALSVRVTGPADATVRWVASIRTVEVVY